MDIPKLRKHSDRKPINIYIDKEVDDLYRLAKQNGYNSSEIVRKAVTEAIMELAEQLKRPATY